VGYDDSGTGNRASGFTDFINGKWAAFVGATAQGETKQYKDPVTGEGVSGIDFFANLMRHEEQHRLDFNEWWYTQVTEPVRDANGNITYTTRRVPTDRVAGRDLDGDKIPDAIEPNLTAPGPYDPGKFDTFEDDDSYGDKWNDSEHHAKKSQKPWPRGSADSEDWGFPGRQHQTPAYDD